ATSRAEGRSGRVSSPLSRPGGGALVLFVTFLSVAWAAFAQGRRAGGGAFKDRPRERGGLEGPSLSAPPPASLAFARSGRRNGPRFSRTKECLVRSGRHPPIGAIAHHRVERDQQLAHAGGENDLRLLAGEPRGEGGDRRIEATRGQRPPGERVAHRRAPAFDMTLAMASAAVIVERRQTDQTGDGASRQRAGFGQQRDPSSRADRPD